VNTHPDAVSTPAPDAKHRDPLEPLSTTTGVLLGLLCAGLVLAVGATIFASGSVLGWGRSASVCVTTNGQDSGSGSGWLGYIHLPSSVSAMTNGFRLCTDHPSTAQRLWFTLQELPTTVLLVGAVLLTYLFVRSARRSGVYTPTAARRLRVLGWFLIVGPVAQTLISHFASSRLAKGMIVGSAGPLGSVPYSVQWAVLLAGTAVLSFARILRLGSGMREELDGLV
jgi:Protein of unknown function (DUF2975)